MNDKIEKGLENLLYNSQQVTELLDKSNVYLMDTKNNAEQQEKEINKSSKKIHTITKSFSKLRSWLDTKYNKDEEVQNHIQQSGKHRDVRDYLDLILIESEKQKEQIKIGNDILDNNIIKLEENTSKIDNNTQRIKTFLKK